MNPKRHHLLLILVAVAGRLFAVVGAVWVAIEGVME
jgi:hypothetical protein